jgi:predicted dehydrogenase
MTRNLRFGIIGCGLMGREFASSVARWCHFLDLDVTPEIVAACSGHETSFSWFKKSFPSIHLYSTDYRDLLADPGIDAIYCSVPHYLHESLYIDTIEAGKHLFGEKPFGIGLEANERILAAARSRPGLVIRSTSQFPFYPGAQRIIRMAREGRFGKVIEVEAGLLHSSDLNTDKTINWKRIKKLNGEYGCMGDLGLHVLHVPLRLGWVPRNVRAILSDIVPFRKDAAGEQVPCDTWDNATLFCEVETGEGHFPMTLKTQRIAPGEGNTWYLSVKGTQESARFSTKFPRTLETLHFDPHTHQGWLHEDLGSVSVYKTITGGIFEFGFSDAFQQMIAAYCDQISKGPDAVLPFGCASLAETHLHHQVLTAALESHRHRQVTPVLSG